MKKHKRITAWFLSTVLALVGVLPSMVGPTIVKADDWEYKVDSHGDTYNYNESEFLGDDASWESNVFNIVDYNGNEYIGFCAQPKLNTTPVGTEFSSDDVTYYDNTSNVTKALYYGWNGPDNKVQNVTFYADEAYAGGNSNADGTVHYLNDSAQYVITHAAVAYYSGDDNWDYLLGVFGSEAANNYFDLLDTLPDVPSGYYSAYLSTGEGSNQNLIFFAGAPKKGYIKVNKSSGCVSITDDNNMYSLKGAEYGIYTESECINLVDTLIIGDDQSATSGELDEATYYVKETKAPEGFQLDSNIYSADVKGDNTVEINSIDYPHDDPAGLFLNKKAVDRDSNGNNYYSLENAEYTVKYYDVILDHDENPMDYGYVPKNSWVFKTDEHGVIILNDYYLVGGDSLYTNAAGMLVFPLGTLTFQETKAPFGYELNDEIKVSKVFENQFGLVETYNFPTDEHASMERPLFGSIHIAKYSTNTTITDNNNQYSLEGAEFTIYKDEACTVEYRKITTDVNGNAYVDKLPYADYWIKETFASKGFLINPKVLKLTINSELEQKVTVDETPATEDLSLILLKRDSETGKAQGDAKLEGAEYKVSYYDINATNKNEVAGLEPKYTWNFKTDSNGEIIFDEKHRVSGDKLLLDEEGKPYVPLGTLTITEVNPSEGYLLSDEVFVSNTILNIDQSVATTNLPNEETKSAKEDVVKGKIALIKHSDNGDTQLENPEEAAEFEVYLKKNASFANSPENERDRIVTNKDGYGVTKLLPYGTYVVHQIKGKEGTSLLADFEVVISKNDETYRYIANNGEFESHIKIVKKDAETGAVIARANAGFKIFDSKGNPVTFEVTYPNKMTIDTFYTNEEGIIYTPEEIPYGKGYKIVEVEAPYMYIKDETPVFVDIDENSMITEDGLTVVIAEKTNVSVKGQITVKKTGEVLVGFDEKADATNRFKYEMRGLANAKYSIYADEDIYTPDNQKTIIYHNGDLVETLITDSNGEATSKKLPLGKYKVVETEAPYGMVLNTEAKSVTLSYKDQVTPVIFDTCSFVNERQKIMVIVYKKDSVTKAPIKGTKFGLYAAEDIMNVDNQVIVKKDTLIEDGYSNEEGTLIFVSDLPFSKFEVKELDSSTGYGTVYEVKSFDFTYTGQNEAVQKHEEEFFNDQTVIVGTTAIGVDDSHIGAVSETFTMVDHVSVKNLVVGKTYTLKARLMNAATGKVIRDKNGAEIVAEKTFVAAFTDGIVDVEFTFDSSILAGTTTVVFESLWQDGIEISNHYDLSSESQTIYFPEIQTTANIDGNKTVDIKETITLVDTVHYSNLIVGKTYVVKGVLMNKQTAEKLLDKDGNEITSEVTFIPHEKNGSIEVEFTFNLSNLEATTIVVFEELYYEDHLLCNHTDFECVDQTVELVPPKTGDSSNAHIYLFALIASLLALLGASFGAIRSRK